MDTKYTKKAKRHTTPSSLIRSISKRLSAPIRSENKQAHCQNEQAYSGGKTTLHERRDITKRSGITSLGDFSKPPRPSSEASSSMQSRPDSVMPARSGSSAESSISPDHEISSPMVSAAITSSILKNYSDSGLVDAGKREDHGEGFAGDQAVFSKRSQSPSTQSPASPSLKAVVTTSASAPLESLPLTLTASDITRSTSEYVSPRSQWTMTTWDLAIKEQQAAIVVNLTKEDLSHDLLPSINELRQHIRDCSASSTTASGTGMSTPETELLEEPEFGAEPCYASETVTLGGHCAEAKADSYNSEPIKPSVVSSMINDMAGDDASKIEEKATQVPQEDTEQSGLFSSSSPSFRRALQSSPADENSNPDKHISPSELHKTSNRPAGSVSHPPPVLDPILLKALLKEKPKDETPSFKEMRTIRNDLAKKILNRNPDKWSGGTDVVDRRIAQNKRLSERRFVVGVGWID